MMVRMVFYAPLIGIGGIIKVFSKDSPLSWLIGVAVLALVSLIIVVFSVALPKFKLIQKLVDRINLVARENLSGMMVIRSFNMQAFEEDRFDKANVDLTAVSLFINRVMVVMMPLMMLIMNLLMVATPLAMEVCRHPYASAALVLEWHVIGMFLPGLFTGGLITRFGVLPVIVTGCVLMLACVAIALTGVELMQFVLALTLLGVGWNFMYTGATTMLTSAYRPSEKNKVQGFMDLCVFTTMVTTSASSGAMLMVNGWSVLNLLSLPIVLVALGSAPVSYTHLRAHETVLDLVCRLLLEKKKTPSTS